MFQVKGHDFPSQLQSVWCGLPAIMWCPTVSPWPGDTEMLEQSRQTRKRTPTALCLGWKYGNCLIQNSLRALTNRNENNRKGAGRHAPLNPRPQNTYSRWKKGKINSDMEDNKRYGLLPCSLHPRLFQASGHGFEGSSIKLYTSKT